MKVNNFGQWYKTHAEASKSQMRQEEINKEQKENEKRRKKKIKNKNQIEKIVIKFYYR